MATSIKISQLPAKGANLEATDLLEVSEFNGTGYVTKSITGQEIIDGASSTGVTAVTGTAPISSSGGTTPAISIATANTTTTGALSSTDWNTFNGKQSALVSGTNIKTLNGSSLLGSGDLSVQDTLVSGTNIKTINSTSLLGSGNLSVQSTLTLTTTGTSGASTLVGSTLNIPQYGGGGGGSGINAQIALGSGNIYSNIPIGNSTANLTISANTIYLMPFIPNVTFTTSNIFLNVAVLGVGVSARILLYNHSSTTGLPDTKIFESANLDCSTTGVKTATTTQTFTAGTPYWLG